MRLAALLALCVVLSGCAGGLPFDSGVTTTEGPTDPWGGEITVAVADAPDREALGVLAEALAYWEANAEQYAGYPVDYDLEPDANDPDLVVRFVPEITDCGLETHVAGCAPYLPNGPSSRPVVVRVRTGYAPDSALQVMKHELGHTLGLSHDDAPQDVMAARSILTTQPQPDAVDRTNPWESDTIRVYLDTSNVSQENRDEVRLQTEAAVAYFDRGAAETVPADISFVLTDDPEAAHITVRFAETLPCGEVAASCFDVRGADPDGDTRLETYTNATVTIDTELDRTAVGWHVGRWLGRSMGFDTESEFPAILRQDASYSERRSNWWE